ncbi:AAA family ATPase [Streptomyces griseorubiginosus]|uniref:AAA family ATPase n=1 Tax=Streptomyces griseorubiginosus TaxID=67304 RepID=UPI00099E81E5|nr:AAA family ATPase [Streptomyces griseorubiginosus]
MADSAPAGNAENFSINVPSVKLFSGDTVTLPAAGVTAIVGPNNSGKSTFIREMSTHIRYGQANAGNHGTSHVVESVPLEWSGTREDIEARILQSAKRVNTGGQGHFVRPGAQVHVNSIDWRFSDSAISNGLQEMYDLLVFFGDAWQRINGASSVEMRDIFDDPAVSPLHVLQDRGDLFSELCNISMEVFGQTLTLDRLSRQVNLRVGEPGIPAPAVDNIDPGYRDALSKLPMLMEQGDGMKSLIGLLVSLVTSAYPIVFIDEPEAFLHPPQAIALGRILGEQARVKNTQIVLATHDRNLLSGLLQSEVDVSIVRLERRGDDGTRAHQLNVGDLREIWNDPVLRYSNVLDGLFHKAVVLAEAERDCTFYASALEYYEPKDSLSILPGDVLFVPSGGKDGFPRLVKVLRSVSVPVVVSPDLDILNDRGKVRILVESMGKDWSEFQQDYDRATAEFRQPREVVTVGNVLAALNGVFTSRQGETFTAGVRQEFMAQLRSRGNPWSALKEFGELAFRGDPVAAQRLLGNLEEAGIVPVRVGELERFAPNLGVAKGAAWLPAAITAGCHKEDPARRHVAALLKAAT